MTEEQADIVGAEFNSRPRYVVQDAEMPGRRRGHRIQARAVYKESAQIGDDAVAVFARDAAGDFAYECFKYGLSRLNGSLRTVEGEYLVGVSDGA